MAIQISKIIDGLRYNTATATEICSFRSYEDSWDFRFEVTTLYRTPRGRFFLAGHGGALTRWSRSMHGGQVGGSGLTTVSTLEARTFAEQNGDADTVAKYFEFEDA